MFWLIKPNQRQKINVARYPPVMAVSITQVIYVYMGYWMEWLEIWFSSGRFCMGNGIPYDFWGK